MDTMKRLSLISLLLSFGLGVWADNNITLSNVQGTAGAEVTVSVAMTNSDAVSALQLSIPLDGNLSFVQNSLKAGTRLNGHSISGGVRDGMLNLMVYSTTMAAIKGNEGEVCSFKLLLGDTPGTFSLTPSKTTLTGTNGNTLIVSATLGTIEIRGAKVEVNNKILDFGRVAINKSSQRSVWVENVGNETLTISEIAFSSSAFSTTTTLPKIINAGNREWIDVTCKPTTLGDIDEEMTLVSNSASGNSTIRLTASPYAQNEIRLGDASGMTDEEVTVPVILNNADAINGFQLEIKIPNELEYVDGSFVLSNRKQDHVATTSLTGEILNIVAYSPTDKPFAGNEGEIGSFKVKIVGSDNTNLNIDNAKLASNVDGKTTDVLSGKSGCTIYIESPNMYVNRTLDFGRISIIEEDKQKSYTIRNWGSAPLTISAITFANGLFSIKEKMPITIEPSSEKTIMVVCEAKEAGDISTNMEIYSNDPQKRLFIVKIAGSIIAPDYLTGTIEANRIGVNLHLSLDNYSNIFGIQFDINTTDNFTASADNVIITERGKNLSVNINPVSEGKLRVVAYVKNDQFISSGNSMIMTIKLVPKEVLPEGNYNIGLSDILLGSKGLENVYAGEDITIGFGVNGVVPGDANKDGKLGIGDIIAIKNIMAGKPDGYDTNAADANQDSFLNGEDINVVLNFMAGY